MSDKELLEMKKTTKQLKTEINTFKNSLAKFETNVAIIQTGNGEEPYWDGKNAFYCIDKSLAYIDSSYQLLLNLEKSLDYLEKSQI